MRRAITTLTPKMLEIAESGWLNFGPGPRLSADNLDLTDNNASHGYTQY